MQISWLQRTHPVMNKFILRFNQVLVSNPLRRVFIVEQNLLFPEGVAIAELLKAGQVDIRRIRFNF